MSVRGDGGCTYFQALEEVCTASVRGVQGEGALEDVSEGWRGGCTYFQALEEVCTASVRGCRVRVPWRMSVRGGGEVVLTSRPWRRSAQPQCARLVGPVGKKSRRVVHSASPAGSSVA